MIYQEWYLKTRWYDEATPTNPKSATGTLTFTDIPVVTQTVTIGTEVYEICTATASEGNIAVVIGATVTADNAVTKLAGAINANSALVTAVASTIDDTVIVTAKAVGTGGNDIACTETCTNASWGEAKLSGGQYGTPCNEKNTLVYASPYYYLCTQEGGISDVAWQRFTPVTY